VQITPKFWPNATESEKIAFEGRILLRSTVAWILTPTAFLLQNDTRTVKVSGGDVCVCVCVYVLFWFVFLFVCVSVVSVVSVVLCACCVCCLVCVCVYVYVYVCV
jgi:hypothetical protein